ncbi:unnamed protein product, partial [Rangifer tarandus platyrhynchus]
SVRAKSFKLTVGSGSEGASKKTIQNFPNGPANGSLQSLYTVVLETVSHQDAGLSGPADGQYSSFLFTHAFIPPFNIFLKLNTN